MIGSKDDSENSYPCMNPSFPFSYPPAPNYFFTMNRNMQSVSAGINISQSEDQNGFSQLKAKIYIKKEKLAIPNSEEYNILLKWTLTA